MSENKLLEVNALSLKNAEKPLLHSISFQLCKNEILCLVGESGSGKSLTLKSILGLLPSQDLQITHGSIYLNTTNLLTQDKETLRRIRSTQIGFVPQSAHTSLNPLRSIGKQLLEVHQSLYSEALDLLQIVGFADPEQIMHQRPHQLSGGMKQRVLLAMALLHKPELLLLDEPTTALDVTLQHEVLDLLLSLRKKYSLSMIFVTHDLGVVAKIADRVLVMKHGSIVEEGPVQDVLLHPSHIYTKELVDACSL